MSGKGRDAEGVAAKKTKAESAGGINRHDGVALGKRVDKPRLGGFVWRWEGEFCAMAMAARGWECEGTGRGSV